MAEQESSDCPVTDKKDFACPVFFQNALDCGNNAQLRIYGSFPASNASQWVSEKFICDGIEFVERQISRCRSIIFMHCLIDFKCDAQAGRYHLPGFNGLFLSAGNDPGCVQ